jgi:hypothetical protein
MDSVDLMVKALLQRESARSVGPDAALCVDDQDHCTAAATPVAMSSGPSRRAWVPPPSTAQRRHLNPNRTRHTRSGTHE